MFSILIIDDDPDFARSLQRVIELQHQADCHIATGIRDALGRMAERPWDLVLLDVNLPDGNGLAHIKQFQTAPSEPEVVILTGDGDSDGAALAISNGAWDYMGKPISRDNLALLLKRSMAYRRTRAAVCTRRSVQRSAIIGESPAIMTCLQSMGTAAGSRSNVIITGETGTGKELFARAIHENSDASGQLVAVDCASLTPNLLESTLFGHRKGSFTDASENKDGLFKLADNGTIFLDEIAELSKDQQKSLLRVLQEKRFRPVGSTKEVTSNFRTIAATNRNLRLMMEQGRFRQDLFYRLCGHYIEIPPLRERQGDILSLARYYVDRICQDTDQAPKKLSDDFMAALNAHDWPGNVREFVNAMTYAVDCARDEHTLYRHHLSTDLRISLTQNQFEARPDRTQPKVLAPVMPTNGISLPFAPGENLPPLREVREQVVGALEEAYLHQLLDQCDKDARAACVISGLSRARLYELLKKHGLGLK